jgi:hypothetical protein
METADVHRKEENQKKKKTVFCEKIKNEISIRQRSSKVETGSDISKNEFQG